MTSLIASRFIAFPTLDETVHAILRRPLRSAMLVMLVALSVGMIASMARAETTCAAVYSPSLKSF